MKKRITTNNLEDYLPHPKNYKNWFSFYDEIDLRRHLQDVEIVLIEESERYNDNIDIQNSSKFCINIFLKLVSDFNTFTILVKLD